MKKLELNQMESLEGGVSNRECAIKGVLIGAVVISGGLLGGAAWAAGAASGLFGGLLSATECF